MIAGLTMEGGSDLEGPFSCIMCISGVCCTVGVVVLLPC
jgi:hypothetical protein